MFWTMDRKKSFLRVEIKLKMGEISKGIYIVNFLALLQLICLRVVSNLEVRFKKIFKNWTNNKIHSVSVWTETFSRVNFETWLFRCYKLKKELKTLKFGSYILTIEYYNKKELEQNDIFFNILMRVYESILFNWLFEKIVKIKILS